MAAEQPTTRVTSRSSKRSPAGILVGVVSLAIASGIAPFAAAGSWRDDRHRGTRHHDRPDHRRHHPDKPRHDKHHPGYGHHHGPRATIVVRPAWGYYAHRAYAPPPRIVYRRHPYGAPRYHAALPCRPWEGPVWNGRFYEHVYGTVCLMPDGTWQLVD